MRKKPLFLTALCPAGSGPIALKPTAAQTIRGRLLQDAAPPAGFRSP